MAESFMLRKKYGELLLVLNLGYVSHPKVQEVADELMKHIGKRNFLVEVNGTLCVNITKKKEKLLQLFPQIKEGKKFTGSDFYIEYKDANPYEVNWHPENVRKYGEPKSGHCSV